MNPAPRIPWSLEADYVQACSCDYGCPCEFEAPPSRGFCEGAGAWKINRGRYGDVSLDGLALGFVVRTPGPMYQGNGTGTFFLDDRATPVQQEALLAIASGKAGGMPFEIFAAIVTNILPPEVVPIRFHLDGRNSHVEVGTRVKIACEPIKNPVTGEPESVRVEHATGFIFKSAEVVSARDCVSTLPGLPFSWPDKAGFVARVNYSN